MIQHLVCVECGQTYAPHPGINCCPDCGLPGILDVIYDYERAAQLLTRDALASNPDRSIWRYLPLLPINRPEQIQPLQVGWTPLFHSPRLALAMSIPRLFIKDDGRNPTGSFKDRASAVAVVKALEEGATALTCASTGNAGSSVAGFCASAALPAHIFVPATTPEAKIAQLRIFGADVLLVDGSYDQAYYLCNEAAQKWGWYNRNCAINPYLIEGKKTAGFEIAEQLQWQIPDWVVMAVGDGCSIAGVGKAFEELKLLGLIDRLPRLLGVQAHGAASIADAYRTNAAVAKRVAVTLADSIAVGEPRNATKAIRVIRRSGGSMVTVGDDEMLESLRIIAAHAGLFTEPAGAAAFAGAAKARAAGLIAPDDLVVVIATGNGLKDVRSAQRVTKSTEPIQPNLAAVAAHVGKAG